MPKISELTADSVEALRTVVGVPPLESRATSLESRAGRIEEGQASNIVYYNTLALLQADKSKADGARATVDKDPTLANNGSYAYTASTQTWAATTDRVSALNNRLSAIDAATSYLDRIFVNVGYIEAATGLPHPSDANWKYSNYIDLNTVLIGAFTLTGNTNARTIEFFDASYVSLGSVVAGANNAPVSSLGTIPTGARYVRFVRFVGTPFVVSEYMTLTANPAATLSPEVGNGYLGHELIAGAALTAGFIGTDGYTFTNDANWSSTDFLPVAGQGAIRYTLGGHSAVNGISFYTAAKQFISGVHAASANTVIQGNVSVPATARFVRLSFDAVGNNMGMAAHTNAALLSFDVPKAVLDNLPSAPGAASALTVYTAKRKLKLTASNKVMLYGDSISSTDYPWYKDAMVAITGAAVNNGGFSGQTVAQTAADDHLQTIYTYAPDLLIVLLGGNDTGAAGTVGTFDGSVSAEPFVTQTDITVNYAGTKFIQAVDHTIRKVKANYYDIRTRAALTGAETEAQKTALIDALVKPVIVLVTSLPQQRNNASDPFSQPANWKRKRDAIVEVASRNKVHCVDLQNMGLWDMGKEPYWVSPTDTVTDKGIYTMDGLHPNKWGFRQMAETICAEIGL